jgi:hypothetical protein
MIRRSFLTRTLGAIAGAVCAPFVGKAGGEKYGTPGIQVVDIPDFQPSDFGEKVGITKDDIHEVCEAYFSSLKRTRPLTGPACSSADYMAADPGAT